MQLGLPFIHEYSAKFQIGVLTALILISYLNRRARFAIGGLTSVYLAFKILVPVVGWVIYLFKGFAMVSFYIYFFKIGVGYVLSIVDFAFNDGLTALIKALETGDGARQEGQ